MRHLLVEDLTSGDLQRIELSLYNGLRLLIDEGRQDGNWGDIRGTADALIAMRECDIESRFPKLHAHAARWLAEKGIETDEGRHLSWEEEVWDTSVALLGACHACGSMSDDNHAMPPRGRRWLLSLADEDGKWNDEPWESLWALLALDAVTMRGAGEDEKALFMEKTAGAFRWLVDLSRNPDGTLVNWHYSALFVLATDRYLTGHRSIFDEELVEKLTTTYSRMLEALRKRLYGTSSGSRLWTSELWSNALALWALAEVQPLGEAAALPPLSREAFGALMGKFAEVEHERTLTEDRAFACVALFKLHARLAADSDDRNDVARASDRLATNLRARLGDTPDYHQFFTQDSGYYTLRIDKRFIIVPALLLLGAIVESLTEQRADVNHPWVVWAARAASALLLVGAILEATGKNVIEIVRRRQGA